MSLWRLEWLRLLRTRRLLVIVSVYVFFGLTGPLSARYLGQILNRVGNGITIELPPPTPADGIAQYASNAAQIGLLVVVLIAASALAVDAHTEMATFLRTRVGHLREIVLPRYVVAVTGAAAGFLLGTAAAWYETTVLLGAPGVTPMLTGTALGCLFLAFAVAGTALAASLVRSVLGTAGVTVVTLLVMALLGNVPAVGRWMPTTMLSALPRLVQGGSTVDLLPAAAVTLVATVAALWAAIALAARREL